MEKEYCLPDEIDFSKDEKLIALSDTLIGFNRVLSDLAQSKGRLERKLLNHVEKEYHITFKTHFIDGFDLKIKSRKKFGGEL